MGPLTLGEYTDWRHLTTRLVSQLGNKSQTCLYEADEGGRGWGKRQGKRGEKWVGKKGEGELIITVSVNHLCVSQFQPQASPPWQTPGHLKKLFKYSALLAIFVGKCPSPHSFCGGQMPGPPVHPINIQSYWLPYFNKHNCFSSIELHKSVTLTEKRQSKWFYCFYRSFTVDKCSSSTPK